MAPIRLCAIDLDGTLLRDDGTVSRRNLAAIERAHEVGVEIVLATGRPWIIARRTVAEIDARSFVITTNGALTVRPPDWEEFHGYWLDIDDAIHFIEGAREVVPGLGVGAEFGHGAYSEAGFAERLPPALPTREPVEDVLELIHDHGPLRGLMVWHDDYDDRLHELGSMLERLAPHDGVEVKVSGIPLIQVVPTGIDKANALAAVAEELGIAQSEVAAFGDESNDLGMIAWAGLGVAMGNGVDEVRAIADEITTTNEEDGVAVVLERLLGEHQ